METDSAMVRWVTATTRPSWEDNYPPGSVIKLPGRLQTGRIGQCGRISALALMPGRIGQVW